MGTCQVQKTTTPFHSAIQTKQGSLKISKLIQNAQLNQTLHRFTVNDQSDLQQWQHYLKSIKSSDCPYQYLLLPWKKKYLPPGLLCSQSGQFQLIFELCEENLDNRLGRYSKSKIKMKEGDIWYLLFILCKVGRYFQKIGRRIGNICPQNILYNTQEEVRIICSLSYPFLNQQLSFVQSQDKITMIASECFTTFSSPQQFQFRKREKCNVNASETFSVGMTILQCTTFEKLQKIYQNNQSKHQLTQGKINSLINKAENKYSPMLINFLRRMLQWNPQRRIKLSEIYRSLEKYESKIMNCTFAGDNSSSLVTLKMSITLDNKASNFFRISQVSQVNKQNEASNSSNRYSNPYSYFSSTLTPSLRNTVF